MESLTGYAPRNGLYPGRVQYHYPIKDAIEFFINSLQSKIEAAHGELDGSEAILERYAPWKLGLLEGRIEAYSTMKEELEKMVGRF